MIHIQWLKVEVPWNFRHVLFKGRRVIRKW